MTVQRRASKETVLITGASSGLGLELSQLFARDGHDLVLVARSKNQLEALGRQLEKQHQVKVTLLCRDLSAPGSAEFIFERLKADGVHVGVLVNNAGIGLYGDFAETELASELGMIQLNVTALTHLTKLFLKDMVEQGRGRILNVASTAAFQPGPLVAIYAATKAFVLSFSEAIAHELRGTGVTVTALCPGSFKSGFQETARMGSSRIFQGRIMDAETMARLGYKGFLAGNPVVIPGVTNKILANLHRFLPRNFVTLVTRWALARV